MKSQEIGSMSHHMVVWICVCVEIILGAYGESCFTPSIYTAAPQEIDVGYVLSKVHVAGCASQLKRVETSDPDFAMHLDGTIVALHSTEVPSTGRSFSVWAQDTDGGQSKMEVYISQKSTQPPKSGILRRFKRRWSPPPLSIVENDMAGLPKDVELVGSDSSLAYSVYYEISGPGVDRDPVGVFTVDRNSGMLRVHRPVDREEWPQFQITVRVFDKLTNKQTDEPLPLKVQVMDVNDNAPTFTGSLKFSVLEQSAGAVVGQVNTTDRDEAGTDHTKIKYTLLDGNNLFSIDSQTGVIKTKTATLDREVKDKHFITVEIRDMNGASNGLFNTATATILLEDINDNPPVFSKTSHSVNVKENVEGETLLLRIPVEDKDLTKTPNWKSLFAITKGNETGLFRIETDPETNEGLLYLTKPLDYEKNKALKLEVQARNEAELSGTQASWASIPINVNVENENEGPVFMPANLKLRIKEGLPNGTVIGTYTAKDPETSSSTGIRYYAASDPASWIEVVETTGELKIANTVDRESDFVKNDMYNITVKAVDPSAKTGTGTVFITIDDENDNIPLLPTHDLIVCEKDGQLGSVVVAAEDKDKTPYSAPFLFKLGEPYEGKWTLSKLNGTAATLQQAGELPTGTYTIPVLVKDLQGMGDTQTVTVRICRCRLNQCVASQRSTVLGAGGILAMLLGLALLLLLCVLAAFVCVRGEDKLVLEDTHGSGGMLLKSNTEGPGEEVSNIVIVPSTGIDQSLVKGAVVDCGQFESMNTMGVADATSMAGAWQDSQQVSQQVFLHPSSDMLDRNSQYDLRAENSAFLLNQNSAFLLNQRDEATLQTWRTNGVYLDMKLDYLRSGEDGRYADDILHSYGFEGEGSVAGSVGCCSDQNPNDNMDFLNTLGPKFRTLAEACNKK
ncbi:desmocollin 2-like protein [Sardina pilchardus]|uniref:desmocollin 2-like protein n=1 Tax=Sardina pilchardus TaxID=27697 RepID=UPI002E11B207